MVDYVEALKRPFLDIQKFLIGSVLGIIPLVNFIVTGYSLVCTGFTEVKVEKDTLPEWENYGNLFMKGLVVALIGFLLFLPVGLVLFGAYGTVVMSPVTSTLLGGVSPSDLNKLISGEITETQIENWFAQNWVQLVPLFLSATPFLILGAVLALLASYVMPVIILGWLKEGRVTGGFNWDIVKKAATLDYFVNWIGVRILAVVLGALVGWIPLIGTGISMYVIGVFSFTVFAEIYERI